MLGSTAAAALAGGTVPAPRHGVPFNPRRHKRTQWRVCRCPAAGSSGGSGEAGGPPPPAPGAATAAPPLLLSPRALPMSISAAETPGSSSSSSSREGGVGKWAEQYKTQRPAIGGSISLSSSSSSSSSGGGGSPTADFLLPLMTLTKCKLPTESVPLQIFEPRYRLMFKLVNQSASRRFGVVLADKQGGLMESVGALCELTHFVTVPERQRVFINARVVGRFQAQRVVNDKPFVAVVAQPYCDHAPQDLAAQVQLAALEARVWATMQEIRQLASKLFVQGQQLGPEIFSLETRRWSPDAAARGSVPTAAGADPTLMRMVQLAGLLGDEQTVAERTTEYLCSDALRQVGEDERRERFSFALARTLDMGPERLQQLLYCQDTSERLRAVEEHILEGRAYLAARSTLRDMF